MCSSDLFSVESGLAVCTRFPCSSATRDSIGIESYKTTWPWRELVNRSGVPTQRMSGRFVTLGMLQSPCYAHDSHKVLDSLWYNRCALANHIFSAANITPMDETTDPFSIGTYRQQVVLRILMLTITHLPLSV